MSLLIPAGMSLYGFRGAVFGFAASEIFRYAISTTGTLASGLRVYKQDLFLTLAVAITSLLGMFTSGVARHLVERPNNPTRIGALIEGGIVFIAISIAWAVIFKVRSVRPLGSPKQLARFDVLARDKVSSHAHESARKEVRVSVPEAIGDQIDGNRGDDQRNAGDQHAVALVTNVARTFSGKKDGEQSMPNMAENPPLPDSHDHDPMTVGDGGGAPAIVEEKRAIVLAPSKRHALPGLDEQLLFVAKSKEKRLFTIARDRTRRVENTADRHGVGGATGISKTTVEKSTAAA